MNQIAMCIFCCAALVLFGSACGEKQKTDSGKKESVVTETIKGVDKTADHLIGKQALEKRRDAKTKLNKIQATHNQQLEKAVQD